VRSVIPDFAPVKEINPSVVVPFEIHRRYTPSPRCARLGVPKGSALLRSLLRVVFLVSFDEGGSEPARGANRYGAGRRPKNPELHRPRRCLSYPYLHAAAGPRRRLRLGGLAAKRCSVASWRKGGLTPRNLDSGVRPPISDSSGTPGFGLRAPGRAWRAEKQFLF
jgi:hypothetical protein